MHKIAMDRRGFLRALGASAAAILGLRWVRRASASSPQKSSAHSWAMVIDQAKCRGCGYCTLACRATNDVPPQISWNRVLKVGDYESAPVYLPRPCMHCEHAPCVEVCMVGAVSYREDGLVVSDYERCIGCRYCEVACPYGARAFNWEAFTGENPAVPKWGEPEVARRPRGVVEKCSFCIQRIDRGLALGLTPGIDEVATPACVVACPMQARLFGDIKDPDSPVSRALDEFPAYRLREGLGTGPRVYYLPAGPREGAA
jgi:Fe-S-cluster-containing dehydrogenase component